jgi:hypothetical protein
MVPDIETGADSWRALLNIGDLNWGDGTLAAWSIAT